MAGILSSSLSFATAQIIVISDSRTLTTGEGGSITNDANCDVFDDILEKRWTAGGIEYAKQFATQYSDIVAGGFSMSGTANTYIQLEQPSGGEFAQSDLKILFQVANPAYYSFSASTDGSANNLIAGLGGASPRGNQGLSSIGVLVQNTTYSIQAFSSAGAGSTSGGWKFNLTLVNAPSRYNAQQASRLNNVLRTVSDGGFIKSVIAALEQGGLDIPLDVEAVLSGLGIVISSIAHDPPDSDFTVIAQPANPTLPSVSAGGQVTSGEAATLNAWITDWRQAYFYSQALYTSLNRYHGALDATNSYWAAAQLAAVQQHECQLAAFLYAEPGLRSNVVSQLAAAGYGSVTLSDTNIINIQEGIAASNAMPADFQTAAAMIGVDGTTMTNIEQLFMGFHPGSGTTGFPACLTDTNMDAAMIGAASALWYSTPVLLNVAPLPNSSIRFDIPAVTGFTYNVQFKTNLVSQLEWDTLLSTNASTDWISFTDNVPASAQAGFYRISHN